MIYNVKEKNTGRGYGVDATDIDGVRRHIYWNEGKGVWDIYKGKRVLGTICKGVNIQGIPYCDYMPKTGYDRVYSVNGAGHIIDDSWEGWH